MRIDYSKPSGDIKKENMVRQSTDEEQFMRQFTESRKLLDCADRQRCILCDRPLVGALCSHRGIPFIMCEVCGHLQTQKSPPEDYPGMSFTHIYPLQSPKEYRDRKARIYKPKLDWIISCLDELHITPEQASHMRWVEMGCGAGYFLSALLDAGIVHVAGFDRENDLVACANRYLGGEWATVYDGRLADALDAFPAEVYVAFFVLEHIAEVHAFFTRMSQCSTGTVFIFSVPVFGFSCLLDNVFENNFARALDGVLHTQLYTDTSIRYALDTADFEIAAQWVFGQDASDMTRFLMKNLEKKIAPEILKNVFEKCTRMEDSLQSCLDRMFFSDQRHIVAVKR